MNGMAAEDQHAHARRLAAEYRQVETLADAGKAEGQRLARTRTQRSSTQS